MWHSRALRAALIASLVAGVVTPLLGQDSTQCVCTRRTHTPNEFERRSAGTFAVIQSRPQGQFGANVGLGYGADAAYLFSLDRRGILSLRANIGLLQYGHESKRVPLSETVGGRVQVRVSTTNYMVPVLFGPQVTAPSGWVRPYANAGVGGQFFYTESGVDGTDNSFDFANTVNQHDATATWGAGAGVLVPLYQRGVKVLLDLGAQYLNGGRARYLKPGSIQDLSNAQIQITPLESETHMAIVRVGVKIGL